MLSTKQVHAFVNEDYAYEKLLSIAMSFDYQVDRLQQENQLFSLFDQRHPHLIIIDSNLDNAFVQKILKYLLYHHCPYTILFLGETDLIKNPAYGMRELISELNVLGCVKKPILVDDIMETFNKIEEETDGINREMIQAGIANNEFELYYQPSVSLRAQEILGAEALIRWNHPSLGTIGPDRFIPIAEKTLVINDLSRWIFDVCMKQMKAWQKAGLALELAINLSEQLLENDIAYSCLEKLCQSYNIDTSLISLEITEAIYKKQLTDQNKILSKFKSLGFKLTIDDFELKYLTLSEMENLIVDGLKLNRCHIIDLDQNQNSKKTVKSLIEITHNYNIDIGATGVESLNIWQLLTEYGCNHAQGYYICKPVAVADFNKWVGIKQED